MVNLTFADSHNMVAYLEKSEDNANFAEIVDFLNASPIRYAITTTEISQSSGATTLVANKTVHEERGVSVERAATTATSLDGTGLGSSPRCQETIGNTIAQTRVLDLENVKDAQALEIKKLKKRVKKLEKKKKVRTPQLRGDHTDVDVSAASPIRPVDDSITDDITLVETLMETKISASRSQKDKGVMFKEPSEPTTTSRTQPHIPAKDKGKGIMQEPEKPVKVKGKDQIEYDADVAQRLQAELDEEARLEREKEEEANNVALIEEWDSIKARIDVDAQLTKRLEAEEREHMSVEEQARLLMEFITAKKKFFAAQKLKQRNKPPTKAEQRNKICTYMKHMEGYKDKKFKGKSFDAIKQMFDKAYKQVNDFVPMDTESSRKKVDSSRKKAESKLKDCLEIVSNDDSVVNIESLATKYLIVDWKTHILAEDIIYYQIIRADGSTKNYKIFSAMLNDFDRQDVLDLYKLVKERFETTSPEGYDRLLWGDLITLFKPSEEDEIWRNQQDYILISWKLYDSCRVHLLLMNTGCSIHMLIEKKYPLTQEMLSRMLSGRLRS
ncbi:hypothetical protein Tco_1310556 [Tanacetum coccineum]